MRSSYRARWVVPVSSPPIENGRLDVVDGWIEAVGQASQAAVSADEMDLGDVVVVPGFVNAHTHLELTLCHGRVPYRGSFVEWVRDLVSLARCGAVGDPGAAIREGLRQSQVAGVAAVADIGHGQEALNSWRVASVVVSGFLEVLGMGPRSREAHDRSFVEAVQLLDDRLCGGAAERKPGRPLVPVGLSPHAPYSTDPSIYREVIEFCVRTRRPICAHLAETREEGQFLADGRGPFRELLEEWGLWDGSFEPPSCSPVAYAQRLGLLACRPLLAHVNYASDADLDLLAGSGASVAYCPRTHRFFQHEPHRYRDMLGRGINVCVGTDSLASNDSLSILDELRFLRRLDSQVSDDQLLAMATVAGARAMGLADEFGTLEPGKRADFLAIPLDRPATRQPMADVLDGVQLPQWRQGVSLP